MDLLEKLKSYSVERFIQLFFLGANVCDIKEKNFDSFLAWAMLGKRLSAASDEELSKIIFVKNEFCKRHNLKFEPGYNHNVGHLDMTLKETIPYLHRPLLLYVSSGTMELFGNCIFYIVGFQRLELNGVKYWYRHGPPCSSVKPLLFFHGICTGWFAYFGVVSALGRERAVVLVDLDAIKIKSMQFEMPTSEKYCEIVYKILQRHNISKVSLAAHSFGTITAGWFVRAYPSAVDHLTLIDPVSLLLALPDVAYAFLHRPPSTLIEWIIFLGASRELTISHTLHRNFWWYRNILWLEDVPHSIPVVVGLAQNDEIANTKAVAEYVELCREGRRKAARSSSVSTEDSSSLYTRTAAHAEIHSVHWAGFSHGQVLLTTKACAALAGT